MKTEYRKDAVRMADAILAKCDKERPFMIYIHHRVDGDCIGAGCGMAEALRRMGYQAWVAMPDELPDNMDFLGIEDLLASPADLPDHIAVAVDCSEGSRMGICGEFFEKDEDPIIIDHHVSVKKEGNNIWINGDASSASELCYYVIVALEAKTAVTIFNKRIARCFLTGIVTDTGRFTYTNTRPETLITAGELLELGGNVTEISYNLYDRKTKENFRASALVRTGIRFYCDGKIAVVTASKEDFNRFGAGDDAIEELPSELRDIDGVELSVVLRETEGVIRCNLRSNSYFDCSVFAEEFGGGGHKRAAGFTVPITSPEDISRVAGEVVTKASERF
ncbi:MAG: bifunctional oligoribonuclease/PAP phosphatase NrnA [Clostridiales bacterium]|nr:bifunctional oligoribonuclease/PAP phosphatase NrnA [Clostridiales bacterium]